MSCNNGIWEVVLDRTKVKEVFVAALWITTFKHQLLLIDQMEIL